MYIIDRVQTMTKYDSVYNAWDEQVSAMVDCGMRPLFTQAE